MKVVHAAVIFAFLAGPAYAQEHVPQYNEKDKDKTQVQIQADKAAEKAYQESLSNIPDSGPVDPWGNARAVSAPKVAAKPAARTAAKTVPKPKAASTTN